MDSGIKSKRPPHPRANANILEIITFGWIYKLFKTGNKRDLEVNDLYTTLNDHLSSALGSELEEKWKNELANAKKTNRSPSLTKALIKMFGVKFMLFGSLHLIIEIVLKISQPLLIGGLLSYFNPNISNNAHNINYAYMYAILLTLNMLVSLVLYHATQIEIFHCGMKMRIACCSIIFQKALRLSNTALGETTVGQVVNLLSNDVYRFDNVVIFLNYLWLGPIQTVFVTYFLWQEIGVSSIIGVAILLLAIPLQGWIGKKISEYRLNTAIKTDERIRLMNEIVSGIQVIKMYTWEKPFATFVEYARRNEISEIKGSSICRAVMLSFSGFHARVALVFSIISFVLLGNYISAEQVFVITSYFNLLRLSMTNFFPQGIAILAELFISINRLQAFLLYEEKKSQTVFLSKSDKTNSNSNSDIKYNNDDLTQIYKRYENETTQFNNIGIVVNNATAKWSDSQTENSLENINLTVIPGRLVGVIGPVGAGKSSLLQAILQELPLSEGKITVNGVVSYASQEPWLFAGSVQQNILFGSTMDEERYKKVIQVCALITDLKQLPYGDKTIVGERGVSLSGGQRARINLARSVYKKADIYLLDDPLSAVDTHVARHLFKKCIKGYLRDKTCILITHQTQYLSNVDQIILMKKGNILSEGSYDELQKSNLDFTKMLRSPDAPHNGNIKNNTIPKNHHVVYKRQVSVQSFASSIEDNQPNEFEDQIVESSENRISGKVSNSVYLSYFFAGGSGLKILFFFIICIFTQVLVSGGDFWIAYWVNLEEHIFHKMKTITSYNTKTTSDQSTTLLWWSISRETCFIVFIILIFLMVVGIIICLITSVSVCLKSSMILHNNMFSAIIRATIYFFNTNSSGRILNRFSKDMGAIDDILHKMLMDCILLGLVLISIVIVIGVINVYIMIPTFIILLIFYEFRVFYLSTSRSIKRLEGVTRSPVFAHLNASLQGLTTIRAYGAEKILSDEFDNHQDLHSSAWYLFISSSRAFGLWLDIVCFIYIAIVTFSFLVVGNTTYGGNVGLAITQAISLAGMFQWGMRQSAELENQMTSVEVVLEYTNAPQEDALESSPERKPPTEWPMNGKITFEKFFLRYSTDSQFVIKNLNINIEPMEKVGIVGRTGAGKSSLIAALFRLAINEGNIIIDDIEIHDLGLHELRSKLSIIPQEPFLFSGTMRINLDPFNEYPDHVLWNALDEVELKSIIEDLPNGLNSKVSEGGSNFSVGQKQLVCLARAIIRNNKILILDEATANVDPQTDAFIQNTIKNKFRMCTVLTIAHRLNTVMDSDKVLVMDAGTMVEFDHPYNLLKNKNGFLYKMVEQTGPINSELLHNIASESYNRMISTNKYTVNT
ncbi:multidrug resistance-associated protein 4-like [Melanaphis sacchari]|uniref:multidrug resistance-associated protein 4-like n=1 Tax=Melanaphis sacchari TaxID=742174 RepID=UPI000DC15A99|nr:multidrug resistance-associated protein 4-like [Melanaphis sacchari]